MSLSADVSGDRTGSGRGGFDVDISLRIHDGSGKGNWLRTGTVGAQLVGVGLG